MRAHDPGERVAVRDRDRLVAEGGGARDQLLRVRGALEEAEVADGLELGVARHGDAPRHRSMSER